MRHAGLRRRAPVAPATLALWLAAVAPAAASGLERLVVLPIEGRVSLVFELAAEPRDVSSRRVSATVLELDAGPVGSPVEPAAFVAPHAVRLVTNVAVRPASSAARDVLTARISVADRSQTTIRVSGRRVYVDVAGPSAALARRATSAAAPVRTSAPATATAAPIEGPEPAAGDALEPAIARMEQLLPFLVSATTSPTDPVLRAVGDALAPLVQSVSALDVPADARRAQGLLMSALAVAVTAVDPAFGGDRAAQARQALALVDQARRAR